MKFTFIKATKRFRGAREHRQEHYYSDERPAHEQPFDGTSWAHDILHSLALRGHDVSHVLMDGSERIEAIFGLGEHVVQDVAP